MKFHFGFCLLFWGSWTSRKQTKTKIKTKRRRRRRRKTPAYFILDGKAAWHVMGRCMCVVCYLFGRFPARLIVLEKMVNRWNCLRAFYQNKFRAFIEQFVCVNTNFRTYQNQHTHTHILWYVLRIWSRRLVHYPVDDSILNSYHWIRKVLCYFRFRIICFHHSVDPFNNTNKMSNSECLHTR